MKERVNNRETVCYIVCFAKKHKIFSAFLLKNVVYAYYEREDSHSLLVDTILRKE